MPDLFGAVFRRTRTGVELLGRTDDPEAVERLAEAIRAERRRELAHLNPVPRPPHLRPAPEVEGPEDAA